MLSPATKVGVGFGVVEAVGSVGMGCDDVEDSVGADGWSGVVGISISQ